MNETSKMNINYKCSFYLIDDLKLLQLSYHCHLDSLNSKMDFDFCS